MTVNVHVYPLAIEAIGLKTVSLTGDTFKALLCTGDASTWGSTQEAYQYVSDITTAYTEVASSGNYARVSLTSMTQTRSTNVVTWGCASPITFGSNTTITAHSMFIFDSTIGGGTDSATPVMVVIDFGANESSVAGTFEYTCSSGLATWTES